MPSQMVDLPLDPFQLCQRRNTEGDRRAQVHNARDRSDSTERLGGSCHTSRGAKSSGHNLRGQRRGGDRANPRDNVTACRRS